MGDVLLEGGLAVAQHQVPFEQDPSIRGKKVASERALRFESVDVQVVLEEMAFAGNRINIVILDACRNNPFERRFRGGSRGLAAIDAARGTLVAYATAPGSVAADGDGINGLYTSELLAALAVPDLKAEEVFKRVRVAVTNRTGGAQVPWEGSMLDRAPNKAEVLATGRELGADIVFTYFFKRSANEKYVVAYMFDVHTGEMVKRDMTTDLETRGQASILTSDLLIELATGG